MRYLVLALAAALVACGSPVTVDKPGATQADHDRDAAQCRNETRALVASSRHMMPQPIYTDCMVGKGWRVTPG